MLAWPRRVQPHSLLDNAALAGRFAATTPTGDMDRRRFLEITAAGAALAPLRALPAEDTDRGTPDPASDA